LSWCMRWQIAKLLGNSKIRDSCRLHFSPNLKTQVKPTV